MRAKIAKVPVIMQMEALECGAASLAMILAYYKKWVPLEQVRADCGVSRDGSNAKNMLRAARSYGLVAKGYRMDIEGIRQAHFPCIIHWNFNHFVVLDGFKKNKAVINDPARGVVEVGMEVFDKSFTGVCMQFSPSAEFTPEGKKRSVVSFARERLKGTLPAMLFVMFSGLVATVIGIVNPGFSRIFMDVILPGEAPEWLMPFTLALLALVLLQLVVSALSAVSLLKIQGKMAIVANSSFMWHVLRLPIEFFAQRMAGDIADRQSSNENIVSSLIEKLSPVVLSFAMLVFYVAIMFQYSPVLAVIGVGTIFINTFIANFISRKRVNITRVLMRDSGKLSGNTLTGLDMIETIKASGAEDGYFERWAGFQASVNVSQVKAAKVNAYLGVLPGLLKNLANIAVMMVGVLAIIDNRFTVGMLLAFQGFLGAAMKPADSLLAAGQGVQEMRSSMERIEDVMNYKPDVDFDKNAPVPEGQKLSGAVELKNVTFGYSKLDEPLISGLSLTMRPGGRIALVGASGCGKSTIARLISGLYKPWSGEILFDGKSIDEIPREIFTCSLSVVDQDICLFEDTVAENIKLWDATVSDEDVARAAKDVSIHDDIMQREGGYGDIILEGGKNFSGGQRQRLELARALALNPSIIILDEATSALDAKTEFEVMNAIKARGISCFIVAHRLSTIRDCDEIIVLSKGRVIERGTHDELYEQGGAYARLVTVE